VMRVLKEYEQVLEQVQKCPGNIVLEKRLISLNEKMEENQAWQLESDAKRILTKLGITDFMAKVSILSGGQRKRVALASTLINPADLLILDEPTNHIDNDTVAWLEQYLDKRKGALLMVTHDRYFLDRVTNRIIELDKGKLYSYAGNYSEFLELKIAREEQQEASELKRQNILRNELVWIRRGAKARTTKQKARIERFEQLNAEKPDTSENKLEIAVGSSRLGRKIIEVKHITKAYDGNMLIRDFSYIVLKNERAGIIGANGSGKSTLLNIIAGSIAPDDGTVEIGQTVKIGYFSQENSEMNEELRVIEYIKEENNFLLTANGDSISASQMLERFLFSPQVQWMPISKLSGGEKRRLLLLKILMSAPNVLMLDEPTNDLDIQTLTILEEYLDNFQGALLIVSHDRYFLDRLVDKIFAFEGNGIIKKYIGGYSNYQEKFEHMGNKREEGKEEVKVKKTLKKNLVDIKEDTPRHCKFTFKEKQEYEQIEDTITSVEQELLEVREKIDAASSDFELLQELLDVKQKSENKLDKLIERWAYLNELAEDINKNLK
ncbi:MAG: ABC-F family ATP-binding cassette domain-containing protein, partial [Clostridia bacterium]|nr:ABC-F family ATP-binding cassette domain-containing protein [Clostridia bacterium]